MYTYLVRIAKKESCSQKGMVHHKTKQYHHARTGLLFGLRWEVGSQILRFISQLHMWDTVYLAYRKDMVRRWLVRAYGKVTRAH